MDFTPSNFKDFLLAFGVQVFLELSSLFLRFGVKR
jgi:hypothetical protein